MIAKNPAPPPPRLFSLAQRRWKDSLVGLLHILPRLGKSGGHIPHSSPLFSFSPAFFFISALKPRSFVGAGRETHGTQSRKQKGNFFFFFWRSGLSEGVRGRSGDTHTRSCREQRPVVYAPLCGIPRTASAPCQCELCTKTWSEVIMRLLFNLAPV